MSDLLSPILVTMMDEAHAYICFCALMQRLKTNFLIDGVSMTKKFQHLTDGLLYYDPEFFTFLKLNQADDLLFCYRWLLLEMKREFAFDDCFKVLETLWSSLPPSFPTKTDGLKLFEVRFTLTAAKQFAKKPLSNSKVPTPGNAKPTFLINQKSETAYSKVANLRRQTSGSTSLTPYKGSPIKRRQTVSSSIDEKEHHSLTLRPAGSVGSDIPSSKHSTVTPRSSRGAHLVKSKSSVSSSSLNKASIRTTQPPNELPPNVQASKKITDFNVFSRLTADSTNASPRSSQGYKKGNSISSKTKLSETDNETNTEEDSINSEDENVSDNDGYQNDVIDDEDVVGYSNFNAASKSKLNGANKGGNQGGMSPNQSVVQGLTLVCEKLPEPTEFGDGNPFLIFLCISCLLQHRTYIMQQQFDYQDIAMYFDRMVRKHNVEKTLGIARKLFAEYLNGDWSSNSDELSPQSQNNSSDEPKRINNDIRNDKC